jgi:hypothetical protein
MRARMFKSPLVIDILLPMNCKGNPPTLGIGGSVTIALKGGK